MSIWNRRPAEDVDTERARLMAQVDVKGHAETVRRLQRNAELQDRIEARRIQRAERIKRQRERTEKLRARFDAIRHRLILILPLLGVNALALIGQVGFAMSHFKWDLPEAILFGAVLESIAVYIGWHAHQALLSGDSAIKLRASSYLIGVIVGGLNYDHFASKNWTPTALAVVFGLMSLTSPWLWAMHGRYANRKRLRELGLIDERAPHFAGGRWVHFPVQTWGALRWGIAHNVQDPAKAWDGYQAARRIRAEQRDRRPKVRVTVMRVRTRTVPENKERLKLFWVEDLSGLTLSRTSGSETGPADRSQTGPSDRSQTRTSGRSETNNQTRTQTGPDSGSETQVSQSDQTRSENGSGTNSRPQTQTGPKRRSKKRSKTGSKTKVSDRLDEAIAVDKAHLAEKGRHISAENLARALSIGKPAALDLVKQVRGGHIDVAK